MRQNKPIFPVTKDGEFLGYADEDQIRKNPRLKLYNPEAPKAAEPKPEPTGVDPSQVKRAPGRPKKG